MPGETQHNQGLDKKGVFPLSDGLASPQHNESNWAEFRKQMPVTERWVYLDHAAVSPLPAPTRTAIMEWAQDAAANGDTSWLTWSRQAEELRPLFTRVIGSQIEEIAIIRNTTEGVN